MCLSGGANPASPGGGIPGSTGGGTPATPVATPVKPGAGSVAAPCAKVVCIPPKPPKPPPPPPPPAPTKIAGKTVTKLPSGDYQVGKNVIVTGSEDFKLKALADLKDVGDTKTGQKMMDALDAGRHKTTIAELDETQARAIGGSGNADDRPASVDPKKGSSTTVKYHPEASADEYTDQRRDKVEHPAKAYLGHEMIHAVHNSEGTNEVDKRDRKDPTGNQEESKTIGINDHASDEMTENNLLRELGYTYSRPDHDMAAKSD